ncbi:hypothetical protein [Phaeocystidibacter luteus]|uniref:Uncharacterized protein n=1 Tax=Phaeocystidibacter luteus TaxID=911197 RepID=A0A6N6RFG6_9FLAO|nr:hypothetical protein [Phaeocystidibacter luteus]KAB2805432.1 hypothetical protein F8C67_13335 [Phaeocystidibacter luteus]
MKKILLIVTWLLISLGGYAQVEWTKSIKARRSLPTEKIDTFYYCITPVLDSTMAETGYNALLSIEIDRELLVRIVDSTGRVVYEGWDVSSGPMRWDKSVTVWVDSNGVLIDSTEFTAIVTSNILVFIERQNEYLRALDQPVLEVTVKFDAKLPVDNGQKCYIRFPTLAWIRSK